MRATARWLCHVALVACLAIAGVVVTTLNAASAHAATGSVLGALTLSPASGPLSTAATWSSLTPCPSGWQGSAVLYELNTDGSIVAAISPPVANVSMPFSGTLLAGDTVESVLAASNVTPGGTVRWQVHCSAGAGGTGNTLFWQSTDVTLSPDGTSYTTSCTQATMCLLPPNGPSSLTPAWVTIAGCPAAYLFSAALYTLKPDGTLGTQISPLVTGVDGPFSGTLLADVAQDMSGAGITAGQTDEWAVVCFGPQGPTGQGDISASVYVTLSGDGSSYTTNIQPPLTATTTTLTASPNPAPAGNPAGVTVSLTATVVGADGTNPGGSVEFLDSGGFNIGDGTVNANGMVTVVTTVASVSGAYVLHAVLTPANVFDYASSTGTVTVDVGSGPTAGTVPLSVAIPPTGALTVTVAPGTVNLAESGTAPPTATGTLNTITVTDTRNFVPGWSVSGQGADFIGSGTAASGAIPGDQLGWVPTGTVALGAALGPTVPPGSSPGLADVAQELASAIPGAGFGTSTLSAGLTVDIPNNAPAGPYTSSLTITYLETGP